MPRHWLVRLLVVVISAARCRSEQPPSPFGCLPTRLPARLPESTLSRLVEHACLAPPHPERQWKLKPQLESRSAVREEDADSADSRHPALLQTLQLETADELETSEGLLKWRNPARRFEYWLDEEGDSAETDGEGQRLLPFPWQGWIAPTQDEVPGALCRNHSRAYVRELLSLRHAALWALRMEDASGKLPDGLLYGNTNLLGSWDGCRSVRARLNKTEHPYVAELSFSGQMCSAVITPAPAASSAAGSNHRLTLVPALPLLAGANVTLGQVRYAYCVPSSCSAEDVQVSLEAALSGSGLQVTVSDCHAEGEQTQLDGGDWALVVFLALTAVILLVCTVWDVAVAHGIRLRPRRADPLPVYRGAGSHPRRPHVLVRAFSLYESVPRLMSTATDSRTIGCLFGLRFLTMAWIVLGHIYIIGLYLLPVSNIGKVPDFIQPLPLQIIFNAFPAVDTFLVISGALVSAGLAREEQAGRRVGLRQLPMLYLHRFLRLTPLYAMVVWFTATLLRHIGSGTFSGVNFAMFGITGCRSSWWHNLLYINNFFPNDETVCIDQSWYLALDMQLFLVAPLLVLPVLRWPRVGAILLATAAAASVIIPGVITYVRDLPPTQLNLNIHATDPDVMADFTLLVYNAPWSRAAPYIIGLSLGLVLGGAVTGPKLPRAVCGLLWILSTAVALLVLLGMWKYNSEPTSMWTPAVAVSYAALHRPAWGLCIAWVIWACSSGHGGPVDALLSHAVWKPLSRLTYATYLTSIQLMVWYASQAREPVALGHLYVVYWFLADLLVNLAVAAVFSLAFEWPAAALEKAMRKRGSRPAPAPAPDSGSPINNGDIPILSVAKRDFQ